MTFPLKDYYKLDPDNKMETYEFGILYINEEDKFQMQEIDTAFDYIPDESNDSVIYTKEPTPIPIGVKPVKFVRRKRWIIVATITWYINYVATSKLANTNLYLR